MARKIDVIEVSRGLMSQPRIDERVTAVLADNATVVAAAAAAVDANPMIAYTNPGAAGTTNQTLVHTTLGPRWQDDGVIDVRRFAPGLDADDVDDWTAAIQDAKTAAEAINGTIYFAAGAFRYDTTISSTERIGIKGEGYGEGSAATILRKMADVNGIELFAPYSKAENFSLLTGGTAGDTKDGIVIGAADASNGAGRTILRDVLVQGVSRSGHRIGVNVQNGNVGALDNVIANFCFSHGVAVDSKHISVGNTNAWRLKVSCGNNGGNGLHLGYAVNNRLDAHVEGNTGWGLYVDRSGNRGQIYSESNTAGPYNLEASAFDNVFDIHNPGGTGVIANANNYIFETGSGSRQDTPRLMPSNQGMWQFRSRVAFHQTTLPYSGFITVSSNATTCMIINVNNASGFTIGNTTQIAGVRLTFWIVNTTAGALGAATWSSNYKLAGAWVQPGAGMRRAITFEGNGSLLYEVSRSAADVPNS